VSYWDRWRGRFSKGNPYHDKLGQFSTPEDAVIFVRPRSGYNSDPTKDAEWRGAYSEGKRFAIRRERNALGEGAVVQPAATERGFLSNVLVASGQQPGTVDPIAIARQLAGSGTGVTGEYPNQTEGEAQPHQSSGRDNIHPDYLPVIDKVEAFRDQVRAALQPVLGTREAEPHEVKPLLKGLGFNLTSLGDEGGINGAGTWRVSDAEGNLFFLKVNGNDHGHGGAIEEERAYDVLIKAGLGPSINPVFRVANNVTVQAFFDDAGKLSTWSGRDSALVERAVKGNAQEIANLTAAEWLLGDGDKHDGNYNYYNGRVYGNDYSRAGYYGYDFTAGAFGYLSRYGVSVDANQMLSTAERVLKVMNETPYGRLPPTSHGSNTRTEAALERFGKLKKAVTKYASPDGVVEAHALKNGLGWW